jgi:hypothetical protein
VGGSFGDPAADAGIISGGGAGQDAGSAGENTAADAGDSAGSSLEPVTQQQVYEATCDPSLVVQWGFVTFETTTPGDSQIEFRARAAASEAELPGATFIELVRASSALGTTRCALTGPAPPCPLDLFELLGGAPLVHLPFMELEAVLHPASGAAGLPRVSAFRMDYSCIEGQ